MEEKKAGKFIVKIERDSLPESITFLLKNENLITLKCSSRMEDNMCICSDFIITEIQTKEGIIIHPTNQDVIDEEIDMDDIVSIRSITFQQNTSFKIPTSISFHKDNRIFFITRQGCESINYIQTVNTEAGWNYALPQETEIPSEENTDAPEEISEQNEHLPDEKESSTENKDTEETSAEDLDSEEQTPSDNADVQEDVESSSENIEEGAAEVPADIPNEEQSETDADEGSDNEEHDEINATVSEEQAEESNDTGEENLESKQDEESVSEDEQNDDQKTSEDTEQEESVEKAEDPTSEDNSEELPETDTDDSAETKEQNETVSDQNDVKENEKASETIEENTKDTKEPISETKEEKGSEESNVSDQEAKPEKKKKEVTFVLFAFVSLLAVMLVTEVIFKCVEFGFSLDLSLLRILLFCVGTSGIISVLCGLLPVKVGSFIHTLVCFVAVIYALFEMGIYNMMHSYTTLKTATTMAEATFSFEYVLQYIRQMPVYLWFILLVPVGYYIWKKKCLNITKTSNKKTFILLLVIALACDGLGLGTVALADEWDQYSYPTFQQRAIKEFGIERFLLIDFASLFKTQEATIQQETNETVEYTEMDDARVIDDSVWKSLMEAEEDEDIKTVDEYLMNRTIDGYNDKTGLLEGKNLIYIMIEAFDYIAIDEQLTPTLYKMKEEGWDFSNHYTPKFDTGTSDSELMGEVSLVPRRDVNVYAEFSTNDWTDSIFYLFNQQGYTTQAYHNWTDEFYDRNTMMESMYCGSYKDFDDFDYTLLDGWQSDYEMFELTMDEYINEDKFMTMYITSSTHFPYNTDWDVLGNKYLDEINAVHPDYPEDVKHYISKAMELDKGMEYLLNKLEEVGKLEDTAIVFFADHHPLNMDVQYLIDCTTEVDRSVGMNEFRSPWVVYCPSILGDETFTNVSSTYDILPTILNLYDMDYDPRLYFGTDYFSNSENIVYFPDGDWATDKGIYYASTGEFEPADENETIDDSYITNNTAKVNNAFSISYLIYLTDYFHYRSEITTPDDSMPDYETVIDPTTGEEIRVEADTNDEMP